MSTLVAADPMCVRCAQLEDQIRRLTLTAQDQARALAELTEECPPWAPSIACVYWLYAETRRSDACWRNIWQALRPLVDDIGDMPAAKLTPLVWAQHRARRRAKLADSTLNVALGRVKEMLEWAVANNAALQPLGVGPRGEDQVATGERAAAPRRR